MAVQVLVGANAATDAQAFLSQVTNFTNAVKQLQAAGNKLSNQSEWQGASATKFDADYTQFVKQVNLMETSFFIGREKIRPRPRRTGFLRWRDRLFIFLTNVAVDATEFFRIPPNRVVELGGQVEI